MGAGPKLQQSQQAGDQPLAASDRPPPRTSRHRQWMAALFANLAAVSAGTSLGWTAPTLPVMMGKSEDLDGGWPAPELVPRLGDGQDAWVTSLLLLAALVGALPAGLAANRWGLRRPLLALGLPLLLGWLLILLTTRAGVWLMFTGRVVHGLAVGATTVLVPRYCEEVAEVEVRGALGALLDFSLCNGVLVAYTLGLGLSYSAITLGCACTPLVFFAAFYWMPESPVHLVHAGRPRKALAALAWLRPGLGDAELRDELQEMLQGRGEPAAASPPGKSLAATASPAAEDYLAPSPALAVEAPPSPFPAHTPAPVLPEDSSPPPAYSRSHNEKSCPSDFPTITEVEPWEREPGSVPPVCSAEGPPPSSPQSSRKSSGGAVESRRPSARSTAWRPETAACKFPAGPDPGPGPGGRRSLAGAKLRLGRFRISRTEAKAVFVAYSLMFLQQAAAISAIVAYADTIFSDADSALEPRYATFVLGAVQSAAGAAAALCVERLGRRPLLLVSCLVVSACLVALAAAGHALAWLPPIALWIYIAAFELGIGPLPWFITAELVGPAAGGGAVAINWATAALFTYTYPKLSDTFGQSAVFAAYGVFGMIAAAFVWLAVPETQGKTRAQLHEEMRAWPRRPRKPCKVSVV